MVSDQSCVLDVQHLRSIYSTDPEVARSSSLKDSMRAQKLSTRNCRAERGAAIEARFQLEVELEVEFDLDLRTAA